MLHYSMGCFDVFCIICGNSCHTPFIEGLTNYPKDFEKNTQWLSKCTFLTIDNRTVHGCHEVGCNTSFVDTNSNLYVLEERKNYYYFHKEQYGIFLHTDCWKFILKITGVAINYSHLPIRKVDPYNLKSLHAVKYDSIRNYWEQDFDFRKLLEDKNEYFAYSPLEHPKSSRRVKKIVSQLKIKKDPNRKSPPVSATFFESGTIKLGNDRHFWVKKNGKWNKLAESVAKEYTFATNKLSSTLGVFLSKIHQIGENTETPLFIESITSNGRSTKILFIGSEEMIQKLERNIKSRQL